MTKTATKKNKDISEDILQADKIPDIYRVKYRLKRSIPGIISFKGFPEMNLREWQYGIVDQYGDDAEKEWKTRKTLIIEDSVIGASFLIDPKQFEIVKIEFSMDFGNDEYDKHVEQRFFDAMKTHNKSKTLKGKMFSVGVGDGSAYYVVTKVTKTKATIAWRGFSPDRWVDHFLGYGGSFDRDRIESMIWDRKWDENLWK